ncbi:MAG TPA: GWxTD domain-containing protein [Bacteroidia bacterium]|jgi:GWxTD domain-containing protein|nr:GWxTD domain-containing protein [Bacteroidia bacterium]
MKKGRQRFVIGAVIAVMFSFSSCYTATKVSNQNIVDSYKNDFHTLHPEFKLLHVNDSVSQLYFKINESELLFERKSLADSFSANVKIFCRVTLNYESPLVMDSNTVVLNIQSSTSNKKEFAVGTINLKLNRGGKYVISISTSDLVGKRNDLTYLEANKTDYLGEQNFLVRDIANGHILFNRWFDTTAQVAIQCFHPINKLFVKFYRNNFPIAAPPFSADEYESPRLKSDTAYYIQQHNGIFQVTLKGRGLYHFMADSNDLEGLTLFRFDESYPEVTQAYQMVAPLRYISSNDEFEKLVGSKNPKQDVDNFWLTTSSGNQEKARELIRGYYGRIQDANRYFTSYQEGWKTDRGMIYLVYGAPSSIYRTSSGETWTYGEEKNYMSLTFYFLKLENPFSNNDYALQRQATYRNLWYNAVDLWREGRVY